MNEYCILQQNTLHYVTLLFPPLNVVFSRTIHEAVALCNGLVWLVNRILFKYKYLYLWFLGINIASIKYK